MILHHYIWGDIDIDIIDEVAPHFLIAKHYGNLALFCRLTKHQNHYFRNSDKRFYTAGFDDGVEDDETGKQGVDAVRGGAE